jgi:hypothetical protein
MTTAGEGAETLRAAGTHIVESEVTCGAVPVQIEGRLTDGRFFYFRARGRGVTLGFGDSPDDAVGGPGPVVSFDGIGTHAVGWMSVDLAEALLEFLVGAVVREQEIAAEGQQP